ncbi:hypothetical protein LTR36_007518 [Oleoguttula mirabilis]|uniref:Uncharacterized protein n=1 Tax=Oleoguttula mirabilis TaxID=1507867 RepID=A0AAV9JVE3_9PEZI|nr:hypothetical protein LTR36_007518 [Oleoguttula mirabilis]
MEPRVTKRERKLHLSYELAHRIHSAHIYPITAPNGSTVIVYGHDRGLRILWRGGRRRKEDAPPASRPPTNGTTRNHEVIVIDDDDDDVQPPLKEQAQQEEYEADEDELDPDCPYSTIIQAVDVDLGTEVLALAIPTLPSSTSSRTTSALRSHAVVAAACADGSRKVLHFPLAPPSEQGKPTFSDHVVKGQVSFHSTVTPCRAIAAKIMTADMLDRDTDSQASSIVLVTAVSGKLEICRFSIFDKLTTLNQDVQQHSVPLPHLVKSISFHPSPSSTQLLISDVSGAVRTYDPYSPATLSTRPSSADSALEGANLQGQLGKWVMAFHSSFADGKAGMARRKHVLDAKWILNGKAILALLADGEWGIWDISGASQAGKNAECFVLSGFLGASTASELAEPGKQRRGMSKLAPMTPNTRKAKAEVLFSGPPKVSGAASRGGVSIATSSSRTGQSEESVVLWYNGEVYSIPSLQAFWQRSTNSSGGLGSLYSPGLTHITDINLANEGITSISQFTSATPGTNFGQMNTQRDWLVSTEHRFIILQTLRPSTPAKALFQQAVAERPPSHDQRMLDAGDLDLGGMDRMLDSMANGDARPRKVGFAQ